MRKKQMFFNVLILSATSMFLKVLGMCFKVYLSNKIGAKGMGLYHLIFSVYALMIAFSCAGIEVSCARIVSEKIGPHKKTMAHTAVKVSLCYALFMSMLTGFSVFFAGNYIAKSFLHRPEAGTAIRILSFAIIPVSVSACLKGYFVAKSKIYKISLSQIAEDFLKIFIVVFVFSQCVYVNSIHGCTTVMFSILVSEIASCTVLILFYFFDADKSFGTCDAKKITKSFLSLTLVLASGSLAGNIFRTAENFLIPHSLENYGLTSDMALEKYGMLKGMAVPILLFPSALISSFSTLLIPEITAADVTMNTKKAGVTISKSAMLTFVLSLFVMSVFLCFSNEAGEMLYKNREVGKMIFYLAPFVPLMYLDGLAFTFMTALNMKRQLLTISVTDSFIRLVMIYFLVPMFGFSGVVFTMYVSNILTPVCAIHSLKNKVNFTLGISKWILHILIAVSACLVYKILVKFIGGVYLYNLNMSKSVFFATAVFMIIYALQLFVFGGIKDIKKVL